MAVRHRRLWAAAVLFLLAAVVPVWAATVSVHVDREDIRMGESFILTFSSGKYTFDEPDLSPLHKDFEVLSTQRSQTLHIINRQQRQENKWMVTVSPKKAGLLVIPPIAFGGDVTPARAVEVKEATAPSVVSDDQLFIQTEMVPNDPYVQENVLYTIRLFRAITTYNSSLGEPTAGSGQLDVNHLDNADYKTRINDTEYLVNQKRYLLVPLQSGVVTVSGVEFRGQLQGRNPVVNWLSAKMRGAGGQQLIVRRSEPVTLNVKAIPAAFPVGAHWLPASQVTLSGLWVSGGGQTEVGQPMTWLTRLQAVGLLGKQLNLPDFAVPSDFRLYHEDPERKNTKVNGKVTAVYERRTALVPATPGDYTLPALKVPWWNTETDTLHYAELPETPVQVSAGAAAAITAAPTAAAMPLAQEPAAPAAAPAPAPLSATGAPTDLTWPVLSMAFLILWMMTMAAWWRERRYRSAARAEAAGRQEEKQTSIKAMRRDLRDACRRGDAPAARKILLAWGRMVWPAAPPSYLEELAERVPALHAPVANLNHCLYRPSPSLWRGEKLWKAFERDHKNMIRHHQTTAGGLEPLHRI